MSVRGEKASRSLCLSSTTRIAFDGNNSWKSLRNCVHVFMRSFAALSPAMFYSLMHAVFVVPWNAFIIYETVFCVYTQNCHWSDAPNAKHIQLHKRAILGCTNYIGTCKNFAELTAIRKWEVTQLSCRRVSAVPCVEQIYACKLWPQSLLGTNDRMPHPMGLGALCDYAKHTHAGEQSIGVSKCEMLWYLKSATVADESLPLMQLAQQTPPEKKHENLK